METQNRLDFFSPGDQTALVCLDVPEVQRLVVEQLTALSYKIHTGLYVEDVQLKLATHVYDLVVISEHFNAANIGTNQILAAAVETPSEQRRRQYVVLVGSSLATGDEMEAFEYSVDLVLGLADVVNFRPVLRRGLVRTHELYAPLQEALKVAETD